MKYDLPMPSLGADMDEGKLMEWKVKVGDKVLKNQVIAAVETTKSVVDVESFREGTVMEIVAKEGEVIHVGKPIAVLDILGNQILDSTKNEMKPEVTENIRLKISPAARKMAEENHIDFSQITGSGTEGEITLKDIETKLRTKTEKAFLGVNLRQAIAAVMSRSKKEIPHYYLKKRMNLDSLMSWLDETNKKLSPPDRLLLPALLIRAVIVALKKFPEMNGYYKADKFEASSSINLGIAFSIKGGGVMVPAILDADKMSTSEFNKAIQGLAMRTKEGGLKNRELSEGTFTITNVGDLGSDEVFGIIFPPQVAIVGIGHIRKEPIIDRQDQLRAGFVVDITLSADHRVSDGLLGARFLNEIEKKLNDPVSL
jgi:pyruvate dehydrogenase E2 component (dihydrolipoamide acetyltransferase)